MRAGAPLALAACLFAWRADAQSVPETAAHPTEPPPEWQVQLSPHPPGPGGYLPPPVWYAPAPAPALPRRRSADLTRLGIVLTAVGVAGGIAGALALGHSSKGRIDCGLTGCFQLPDYGDRLGGAAALAGGAGVATVGLVTVFAGTVVGVRPGSRSETARDLGIVVAALGLGAAAAGAAVAAEDNAQRGLDRVNTGPLANTVAGSGTALLVGAVPLIIVGSLSRPRPPQPGYGVTPSWQPVWAPPPAESPRWQPLTGPSGEDAVSYKKSKLALAGALLTVTGAIGLVAACVATGAYMSNRGPSGSPAVIGLAAASAASGAMIGVGIPLWRLGSRKAPIVMAGETPAPSAVPTVIPGAGSAALRWSF